MNFYWTEMLWNESTKRSKVGSPNFIGDDEICAVENEVRWLVYQVGQNWNSTQNRSRFSHSA